MRLLTLGMLAALVATGCTDDSLGGDTTYRRLVDRYDSEAACLAGTLEGCYQTLTLCGNGKAAVDLANRPVRGTYLLDGEIARAEMIEMRFDFDISTLSSTQLPGRHRWEEVTPLFADCAP